MKSKAERLEEAFNLHAESTERNDAAGMAEARRLIHRIYTECVPEPKVLWLDLFGKPLKEVSLGQAYYKDYNAESFNRAIEETLKNIEEIR